MIASAHIEKGGRTVGVLYELSIHLIGTTDYSMIIIHIALVYLSIELTYVNHVFFNIRVAMMKRNEIEDSPRIIKEYIMDLIV